MARRLMLATCAAGFFWLFAAHVLTGFLDFMAKDGVGSRSGMVGNIDAAIDSALVAPLGGPLAAAVLFVAGIGAAWFVGRSPDAARSVTRQQRGWQVAPESSPRKRILNESDAITPALEDDGNTEMNRGVKVFGKFVRHQNDTHEMQRKARSADRASAILTPIVPIRSTEMDSWFGGKPKLPKDVAWPEKNGKSLCFACQINLASLPMGVWSGIGLREGWLAVFLHPETAEAAVLHVRGEVEERDGPGQMSAQWARTYAPYAAESKTYFLPRWPVKIEEGRPRSASASNRAAIWKDVKPDLANAEIHPFDTASLSTLLDNVEEFLVGQLKHLCRRPAMKKLREKDLEWNQETKAIAFQSLEDFYKVEGLLARSRYRFDHENVAALLPTIANLPIYEENYLKDDDEGYCVLEYRHSSLNELPTLSPVSPMWWERYTSKLYWLCINAYTKDPNVLHPAMRERMEQMWGQDAKGFHGAMGHAPRGHIYTPHGPDTDTEVLLELPTSQMQGWIWGDTYSIVLTIKRQALARGDFSEIERDITN